jgi:hypothetical protein
MKNALIVLSIILAFGWVVSFSQTRQLKTQLEYALNSKDFTESALKEAFELAGIESVTVKAPDKEKGETSPSALFGFIDGCTPSSTYENRIHFENAPKGTNYYKLSCVK